MRPQIFRHHLAGVSRIGKFCIQAIDHQDRHSRSHTPPAAFAFARLAVLGGNRVPMLIRTLEVCRHLRCLVFGDREIASRQIADRPARLIGDRNVQHDHPGRAPQSRSRLLRAHHRSQQKKKTKSCNPSAPGPRTYPHEILQKITPPAQTGNPPTVPSRYTAATKHPAPAFSAVGPRTRANIPPAPYSARPKSHPAARDASPLFPDAAPDTPATQTLSASVAPRVFPP